MMIRPKKQSALNNQQIDVNNITNNVDNLELNWDSKGEAVEKESQQANFKQKYLIYVGHSLIQFENKEDQMERGILHIKYARLKRTHLKDDKTKLHGFILMAKGKSMQFYSTCEDTIN
jgi:hypothetical protein